MMIWKWKRRPDTAVIVTAFQRNGRNELLDAREYLNHFLETAPKNGRLKMERGTNKRAVAGYKDPEGDHWDVAFVITATPCCWRPATRVSLRRIKRRRPAFRCWSL